MRYFVYRIAEPQKTFLISLILILGAAAPAAAAAAPTPPPPAFAGDPRLELSVPYLTVSWGFPAETGWTEPLDFELQAGSSPDFNDAALRYRGPDQASFISGLAEGEYFFRVRAVEAGGRPGEWSEPLYVSIEYDSLAKAFLLFGIGALVTGATVTLVVTGERRTRREAPNSNP